MRAGCFQVHHKGFRAVFRSGSHLQDTHAQSERVVNRRHPAGITSREVIINRDEVHTFARQSIQVNRQCRYQRLTFTCTHLCDFSLVQDSAANHLDVIMAQANRALAGFPNSGESLNHQVVQGLTLFKTGAEFRRFSL